MRIAKFVLMALVGILPMLAQEPKQAEKPNSTSANWPVRIFQVKHANVSELAVVFSAFGAVLNADRDLKVLSVRAPKEVLAAIEEAIQRLDVPAPAAKNIELSAYLLIASPQGSSSNVPADLEPVVKQLKGLFNYQGFRLLGTVSLRGRDGHGGEVNGNLPAHNSDFPNATTSYFIRTNSVSITSEGKERVIRIDQLHLRLRVPAKANDGITLTSQEATIHTSIDVREGQKVVVGKANIDNADNALILVLTTKVVD
jgi:Bacterial type II/III secretion system short domain